MMHDSRGQAAMVDAILFMTIMLIASGVIIGSTGFSGGADNGLLQYSSDFASTILAVELRNLSHVDSVGMAVSSGNAWSPVAQVLCDATMDLRDRSGMENYSSVEANILAAGRNLIRPGLDFAISCDGGLIFISPSVRDMESLPPERCASGLSVFTGEGDAVAITVYVWVV